MLAITELFETELQKELNMAENLTEKRDPTELDRSAKPGRDVITNFESFELTEQDTETVEMRWNAMNQP